MSPNHENESGMERLRRAVRILNDCRESFNDQFSAQDLLKIVDAHLKGEWDIYPDQWSARQIQEAIQEGKPAQFSEDTEGNLLPVYTS